MMIELLILIIYTILFIIYVIIKKNKELLSFSVLILSSGLVYTSSIISLLIVLGFFSYYKNINKKYIYILFFTVLTFSAHLLFQKSYNINFKEFIQINVFILLFIYLMYNRERINDQSRKYILSGFVGGSIIITISLFIQAGLDLRLLQENYNYLNISKTFNYTSIYLFFGLIAAPFKLNFSFSYKIILLGLYITVVFIFQTRAAFILGAFFFLYLNQPIRTLYKWLVYLPLIIIIGFMIVNSSAFNPNDPNDILFSVVNFESNTSNVERILMISSAVESLSDNPNGWGVGMSISALKSLNFNVPHAHNLIANWVFEYGLLGIILSILFYFILYRMYMVNTGRYSLVVVSFIAIYSLIETLQYNILVSLTVYFALMSLSNSSRLRNV